MNETGTDREDEVGNVLAEGAGDGACLLLFGLGATIDGFVLQSSTARCNAQIYSGPFSMNSEATATNLVSGDSYGSCAPN